MSISLSMDDKDHDTVALDGDGLSEAGPARRGWWDYVPEAPRSGTAPRLSLPSPSENPGIIHFVGAKLHDLWSYPPGESPSIRRKPSLSGNLPMSQPPRTSAVAFVGGGPSQTSVTAHAGERNARAPQPLPSPSAISRISRYMPRMQAFKAVLKNEVSFVSRLKV